MERDVGPLVERPHMERWVVGSILHGEPIELFLVPISVVCVLLFFCFLYVCYCI